MADKEELVFEIKMDSVEQSLANLTKSTNELKEANKLLAKEVAAGNKEAAAAIERNNAVIKVQQDEYRTLQNNLKGYLGAKKQEVDTTNFSNNSIKANRELLKQLTAQYIGLKNPSQEATNQIKRLSDTLKQQEGVIGDTRRNVGNYAEGIKQALGDLNIFGVRVGNVTGAIKGAGDAFKGAGGGLSGFTAGLSSLGAGAIPLVAGAVGLLSKAFESYAPLADAVERQTAGIGAAFSALVSGRSITDAYEATVQFTEALQDLEDTQESFNRSQIEYNNEVDKYILRSKDASLPLYERILALNNAEKEEKKAFEEAKRRNQDNINIYEDAFKKRAALSEKELFLFKEGDDADKKRVRDRLERSGILEKDINDYLKLLTQRSIIEGENTKVLEKIQNRRNAFIEKEQQDQAKAEEKKAKEETDRLEKQRQERERYNAELEKIDTDYNKTEVERIAKGYDDKIAIIKKGFAGRKTLSEQEKNLLLILEQEKQLAINKVIEDGEEKRKIKEKEKQAKALKEKEDAFNAEIAANNTLEKLEVDRVNRTVKNEEEKQKQILQIRLKYLQANLAVTEALFKADGELSNEELQKLTLLRSEIENIIALINGAASKGKKQTFAEALGIDQETLSNAIVTAQALSQVLSEITNAINAQYESRKRSVEQAKEAELAAIDEIDTTEEDRQRRIKNAEKQAAKAAYQIELEQFKANKALSITQTIISTAQAIMNALATAGNVYAGVALSIAAAATGAIQLGVISATKPPEPPKFATGVIGLNGPGTETSDSIPAYLSKGESVMTAKATKVFAPMLAQMEMAVGNKPNWDYSGGHFATGVIGQYGDGGSYIRSISQPAPLTVSDLTKAISSMPAPVVSVKQIDKVRGAERAVGASATL